VQLTVGGKLVCAATGGRPHAAAKPLAVFLHGAGLDHTVWALQSRWLAFHRWNVLAVDLPGHGASAGPPLPTIQDMAGWVVTLLDALEAAEAVLIGHSMGSLIALETAAAVPDRVAKLVLIGTAAAMPVHPDLLAAAKDNEPAAIDMVNLWGHGFRAGLGHSPAPGIWMVGVVRRILEKAAPGVLFADLRACNAYTEGMTAAARVVAPTLVFCGEMDQMTPLKSGRTLAAAIDRSTLGVAEGAGHMLLAERPDKLLALLARHLEIAAAGTPIGR
jgi:pimeloyl-ACP methyl ester carboxylesterase